MSSLTLALLVVAALGMSFSSTRQIGILSTAILCFLHPAIVILLILIAGSVYFLTRKP